MKSIRNLLPALGLVFGATLAMAMNFATPEPTGTLKANQNNIWVPITESTPHFCDDEVEEILCVARFDQQDQMIPGSEVEGEYNPL